MSKTGIDGMENDQIIRDELHTGNNSKASDLKFTKTQLQKIFYVGVLAFVLSYSGFVVMLDLQSSVNIKDGLGSASLLSLFVVSFISSIVVAPVIIKYYGIKTALVASDISFCLFTIANFHPAWFTMIPTALVSGTTFSLIWSSITTMVFFVSIGMFKLEKDQKSLRSITSEYFGKYSAVLSMGRIFGSGLCYAILYGLKGYLEDHDTSLMYSSSSAQSLVNVSSAIEVDIDEDWSQCLANDCQFNYIYNETYISRRRFKPATKSIYILDAIILFAQLICLFVHALILPRIPTELEIEGSEIPSFLTVLQSQWKKSFHHCISRQHLLLYPLTVYLGLEISFLASEFNRAYVSCTIGVESIGLCMGIAGIGGFVSSVLVFRFLSRFGRLPVGIAGYVIDMCSYCISLWWIPEPSSSFVIYALAAMFGMTYVFFVNVVSSAAGVFFQEHTSVAYSSQVNAILTGTLIGFGWSIPLCVRHKLYCLIPFLSLSVVCWLIAERRFKQRSRNNEQSLGQ